jgi:hypothetical protein
MNSELEMFTKKLQMLAFTQVMNEKKGTLVETLEPIRCVEGSNEIPKTR